jgi:hypothetical protein
MTGGQEDGRLTPIRQGPDANLPKAPNLNSNAALRIYGILNHSDEISHDKA